MGMVNVVQTPGSYRNPPPKNVMDPDSLNSDPDTDSDPAFFLIADPDPDPGFDDLKL